MQIGLTGLVGKEGGEQAWLGGLLNCVLGCNRVGVGALSHKTRNKQKCEAGAEPRRCGKWVSVQVRGP